MWPNYPPIEADQLQQCITHAEHHGPPPAEMLLIRDANSLCAGHDFRRAVLDAGLTAVLAVTQLITAHLTANGETTNRIEAVLHRHQMLGLPLHLLDPPLRRDAHQLPASADRPPQCRDPLRPRRCRITTCATRSR